MKAVIQRIKNGTITVKNKIVGQIASGLLIYYGVDKDDKEEWCDRFCDKILKMRIFEDEMGKMNKSVVDVKQDILLVSQFTLSANVYRGNRPSFDYAAEPGFATKCYEKMIKLFREKGIKVETGVFGAHMDVAYLNDGPITFLLDSDKMNLK